MSNTHGIGIYNPRRKRWANFPITETRDLSHLYNYIAGRIERGHNVEARFTHGDSVIWRCVPVLPPQEGERFYYIGSVYGSIPPFQTLAYDAARELFEVAITRTTPDLARRYADHRHMTRRECCGECGAELVELAAGYEPCGCKHTPQTKGQG